MSPLLRRHRLVAKRLDPGETVEAGWIQLGFTVAEGTFKIGTQGHRGEVNYTVRPLKALVNQLKEVKDGV